MQVDAAHLLEVGELAHFHAVEPHFPAQAPGTQGRRFPVVFHKADIVLLLMNAQLGQALQIELLDIFRRGLNDDLELMMLEQTVGVIAITTVSGATGGLYISHTPGLRAQNPQKGGRVHGASALFNVVGLCHDAFLISPEFLQFQNNCLKIHVLPPI